MVASIILTLLLLTSGCVQVVSPPSPSASLPPTATITQTAVPPTPTKGASSMPEPTDSPQETPIPTPEPTPEATPTPEPAEECVVESCEPYQEIALYHGFSDEQSFSQLVPGTNKTFLVKDRRDGRMLIEVTEPSGAKWEAWADDNSGAYGPVGEAPPAPTPAPTPETPPAAVCTEPFWKERTVEGRAGIVNYFGEHMQLMEPGRPYIMKYYRAYMRDPWYTRRDALIIQIDKQAQVVTYQLSDGSTRQRRFTRDTIMIMEEHDKYVGTPEEESVRYGGNLCDLGIGDAVSILHPHEPESANPNPNLVDLFGVLFVR